ncbi:MAG: alpha/beta hydrolase [Candidatus Competibacter sp.]|nr:alpha/beta hydrolase [Candidatus Competibacter sp.]
MPYLTLNGAHLYYEDKGTGPETIVFAHGLLWSGRMFDQQVAALQEYFRCITFDFRGHGQSQVTASGYDMDTLTEDAAALMAALGCAPCHFVGLSMGGFVGMRLAFRYPHLIRSLVLMETSADPEPQENIGRYRLLNFIARWLGWRMIVGRIMPIMFGQKFLNDPARAPLRQAMKATLLRNHRVGLTRAVTGVIERAGVYENLQQIRVPTLIIVGDQDVATVPAKAERIHVQIPRSRLAIIPGAGHTSTVEEPEAVNQVLLEFLGKARAEGVTGG